jgi:hypothetical protein
MVVKTKPWKSSVTCVLLSHLTPATNQNFTDKVTMIMHLFHSTKFTCHANLQYRSFTSRFRRNFLNDSNCQDMRCTVHQDSLCWFLQNNALSCSMSRVLFFLNPTCTYVHKISSSTSLPDLPFTADTHQTAAALFWTLGFEVKFAVSPLDDWT